MDVDSYPRSLFLAGCGNMAGAMLSRWLECGLDPSRVLVFRPSGKSVADGVQVTATWPERLPDDTLIMLGMKPDKVADAASRIAAIGGGGFRLLSMLAGTTVATLRGHFPSIPDIVRVMPNTPVAVGQGVCALYCDERTGETARRETERLMSPLGLAEWIADEDQFNLVTALSGCGPAYLFRFIDALAGAAARLGLPADQAGRLALATVQGASTLAAGSEVSPAVLADRVASPGGMTREGMNVLDEEDRLLSLLTEALRAARDRGEAIARAKGQ